MEASVTVDKAGRLVLPKPVRDLLRVSAGDTLDLSVEGERVILRIRRPEPPLQKERGIWVFRTGEPLSANETDSTLKEIRERRASRVAP
ncbi:MAG: AbrB/MazE/SpoVT family DNA-binding domain-containing protein [Bryobacterales bacterium]|jgi:AbrB family looped-hinge helix DNA binding protein|nr:AbrB/MazE/SpoVT family DNA-binding domain-containing protein [Bryobacterales bacterium]